MVRTGAALAIVAAAFLADVAQAQSFAPDLAPRLIVAGEVPAPLDLDAAALSSLPRVEWTQTEKDGALRRYSGVDLALILEKAGAPIRAGLRAADAGRYVHAQARDGYVAVFALAEFDRGRFIVVDRMDGAALFPSSGPLQLAAVSDDPRRTRWAKRLTRVEIRRSAPTPD
jgi:DMSO/TMAO reductase YedYZ molybdopterin-dependent catalytic subunit